MVALMKCYWWRLVIQGFSILVEVCNETIGQLQVAINVVFTILDSHLGLPVNRPWAADRLF